VNLGLMFFSSVDQHAGGDRYGLLLNVARVADAGPFVALWTPERHFHPFGGLFPNPTVTTAACAAITSSVQLRAGSLVSPLHNEIRVAEDWAVLDNLSGGRVAISFGSGWNIEDFALWPERYERRKDVMYEQIATIRRLWRGETIELDGPDGRSFDVQLHPRPLQAELPVWVTSSGDVRTFERAGAIGANVLTHLLGQDLDVLATKIAAYRRARTDAGVPGAGTVTLMLHTYVGSDDRDVRHLVQAPLSNYLASAISLEQAAAAGGGPVSGGRRLLDEDIPDDLKEELVELAFERYYESASLLGSPDRCVGFLRRLVPVGVDEIACLIDFGVPDELVLESLSTLAEVAESVG